MNYDVLLIIIKICFFCKEIKTSYDFMRLPRTSYAAKPAKQLSWPIPLIIHRNA